MTTINEQIKCPVCGERMKIGFYADNMECTGCELELPRTVMKAIQSRIDKEKAAAVQEERERVIKWMKENKYKGGGSFSNGWNEAMGELYEFMKNENNIT